MAHRSAKNGSRVRNNVFVVHVERGGKRAYASVAWKPVDIVRKFIATSPSKIQGEMTVESVKINKINKKIKKINRNLKAKTRL